VANLSGDIGIFLYRRFLGTLGTRKPHVPAAIAKQVAH
jgi:hypothetical protein